MNTELAEIPELDELDKLDEVLQSFTQILKYEGLIVKILSKLCKLP